MRLHRVDRLKTFIVTVLVLAATAISGVGVATAAGPPRGIAPTRLHNVAAASGLVTLNGVSCVDATHCVAVGTTSSSTAAIEATTDGSTWVAQTVPAGMSFLSSVSCVDSTHCFAVGDGIIATTDGSTWLPETDPAGFNASVACTDATHCIAVGGLDWISTTDGSNWAVQFSTTPSSFFSFDGVSCVNSSACLVVGEHQGTYFISATSIGGAGGGSATTPPEGGILLSGVCSDGTHCFAVGSSSSGGARILATTNGSTYDYETAPSGISGLNGVFCADSTHCVSVGSTSNGGAAIIATTDGSTWISQVPPNGLTALNGVSCVSTTHCTAVGTYTGGAAIVTTTDGFTWRYQLPAPTSTSVIIPSNGATLAGSQWLDATASNASSVEFVVFGGSYWDHVIGTATPTYYGWLYSWNTTTVPNGSYVLFSEAFGSGGSAFSSPAVNVTVNNPPPRTTVVLPPNGATLAGSQYLDASASSGVTKVEFHLTGGTLHDALIATATPTYYGWIAGWNTTTVPNCTYTLQSVAYYAGGVSGRSAGITITVAN
jgi:hypothetical protein